MICCSTSLIILVRRPSTLADCARQKTDDDFVARGGDGVQSDALPGAEQEPADSTGIDSYRRSAPRYGPVCRRDLTVWAQGRSPAPAGRASTSRSRYARVRVLLNQEAAEV
jgi:hypothetical protein